MVKSKLNHKNPLQKEPEAASIDSVMAEDHAVLLKSVKKSKSKAAFYEIYQKYIIYQKGTPSLQEFHNICFMLIKQCQRKVLRPNPVQTMKTSQPGRGR